MSKWTADEISALNSSQTYHDWGQKTGYTKSFDAWEVKHRRVAQVDPSLAKDEEALLSDYNSADARKSDAARFAAMQAAVPHVGAVRTSKPYVGLNIAYLDIEATDLKGNFGRLLCMSVADVHGNVRTLRADDPLYRRDKLRDDSLLAVACRDYLETFDMWVGWNSKMYDIPFIDTRLLIAGERPLRKDVMHADPMYKAGRFSLALHSRRLDAVAKTFRLGNQKTPLDFDVWQDAAMGDPAAIDYVVQHCEADVLVLRDAFDVLKPLIKTLHR